MSKESFQIPCQIAKNGLGISLYALADSGANRLVFIDIACARKAAKLFGTEFIPLKIPYPVRGYDGALE